MKRSLLIFSLYMLATLSAYSAEQIQLVEPLSIKLYKGKKGDLVKFFFKTPKKISRVLIENEKIGRVYDASNSKLNLFVDLKLLSQSKKQEILQKVYIKEQTVVRSFVESIFSFRRDKGALYIGIKDEKRSLASQ